MTTEQLQTKGLVELLDLLPSAVEYKDKQYDCHISLGKRWSVDYSCRVDEISVGGDGVSFYKMKYLFDTFRSDNKLKNALVSMLWMLYCNRSDLMFIPRIHPFQTQAK